MNKIKVMTVFGTRPEAIKMAPLVHALEQNENTESIVCVTAQHREMLDQVLDIFDIKPDYDLNIMQPRQTLATITEKSLHGLDEVLEKAQPDIVLVHGDTSTTFAGALAAFYHKVPVGHVEAGLRTYDKYSPFPEEMNRKLTGQIATLHFAPTPRNRDNLAKEGITDGVFVMGNTVVDAIHMTVKPDFEFRDEQLKTLDFENNRVVLVTAHRRENYGELPRHCRAERSISGCTLRLSGAPQPVCPRNRGEVPRRQRQDPPHPSAGRGRDAQPDGTLLSHHDRLRRTAGGGAQPW